MEFRIARFVGHRRRHRRRGDGWASPSAMIMTMKRGGAERRGAARSGERKN